MTDDQLESIKAEFDAEFEQEGTESTPVAATVMCVFTQPTCYCGGSGTPGGCLEP